MKQSEITVRVDLHRGDAAATVWTCDLSHDYVSINADYRSAECRPPTLPSVAAPEGAPSRADRRRRLVAKGCGWAERGGWTRGCGVTAGAPMTGLCH